MDKILAMDKIFDKIAALGVPALVLVVAMAMTGLYGAAAITAALAMIGPFGIIGGIATLGILGLISKALAEYGLEVVFKEVLNRIKASGKTNEEIREIIAGYWFISKALKKKLRGTYIQYYTNGLMSISSLTTDTTNKVLFQDVSMVYYTLRYVSRLHISKG